MTFYYIDIMYTVKLNLSQQYTWASVFVCSCVSASERLALCQTASSHPRPRNRPNSFACLLRWPPINNRLSWGVISWCSGWKAQKPGGSLTRWHLQSACFVVFGVRDSEGSSHFNFDQNKTRKNNSIPAKDHHILILSKKKRGKTIPFHKHPSV